MHVLESGAARGPFWRALRCDTTKYAVAPLHIARGCPIVRTSAR
jgi:hypothetical protein